MADFITNPKFTVKQITEKPIKFFRPIKNPGPSDTFEGMFEPANALANGSFQCQVIVLRTQVPNTVVGSKLFLNQSQFDRLHALNDNSEFHLHCNSNEEYDALVSQIRK